MIKRYNYRIYPSKAQQDILERHFGCCRWVWNWGLAKRMEAWAKDKTMLSRNEMCAEITKMRHSEKTAWLAESVAQSLQSELVMLDMAYTKFFKKQNGYPKFKTKKNRQRLRLPQNVYMDFDKRRVTLPKVGDVPVIIDRTFDGDIKTTTVMKVPSGKYFVSIAVNTPDQPKTKHTFTEETTVGIDLGLKDFATLSTGEKIPNPRFLEKSLKKQIRENRRWRRKQRGSKNQERQRKKIALIYERVSNQRTDFLHKLSTRVIRENQAIALEDLNTNGMARNRRMSRAIWDVGWSLFNKLVEYKAEWYGKTVLRIGRFAPSSRLCTCGVVNHALKLKDRVWTCPSCGATHDRDILAANNIKKMALTDIRRGTPESTPVETGRSRTRQRSRKRSAKTVIATTI